jgi:hypothetical protein
MGESSSKTQTNGGDIEAAQGSTSTSATASANNLPEPQLEEVAVQDGADREPPTPRFLEEEGAGKRWKWIPYPIRRTARTVGRWARGPPTPITYKIKPIFPTVQQAPIWLIDRYLPNKKHKIWLVMVYFAVWIVAYALVMRQGLRASDIPDWGTPSDIGCGNTFWVSGNQCGLDGDDCRPFNGSGFAFKCPASCSTYSVLNPRAVGTQEVIYQPLIIGGPNGSNDSNAIYRGDSFICGAAIHAGVITDSHGGCGVVNIIGTQSNFVASERHGLSSVGFDSYFPLAYTFANDVVCSSQDMRWPLLALSVVFTSVLSLFTTSSRIFYFANFVGIFWNTGLATDVPNHSSIADLVSNIIGKFLPAMFVAWVMYDKMGIRRTLKGLTAQIEKTVLWLGACWVGALTNYTFDFIPIQRLTPHDLQQQPGARAALAIIILVLLTIAVSQVWFFRQEGRLIRYLQLYLLFVVALLFCLALPNLSLRIHHYILGLLLLPGTSIQTRPCLLYQGLLVGFVINGIARWGFDPILQTSAALLGDGQLDSPLPAILAPIITLGANISTINFKWGPSPGLRYDGISVLVNDVERFRTYFADGDLYEDSFTWTRKANQTINEYFRFAYMEGSQSDDYTKAGVWNTKGEWIVMADGPSRVKSRSLDGEVQSLVDR